MFFHLCYGLFFHHRSPACQPKNQNNKQHVQTEMSLLLENTVSIGQQSLQLKTETPQEKSSSTSSSISTSITNRLESSIHNSEAPSTLSQHTDNKNNNSMTQHNSSNLNDNRSEHNSSGTNSKFVLYIIIIIIKKLFLWNS